MKSYVKALAAISLVVLAGALGCTRQNDSAGGDFVYKIETGGVLAGYAVLDTSREFANGEASIRLEQHTRYSARLLGADVDSETI